MLLEQKPSAAIAKQKADRYNEGKLKASLVPHRALKEITKVFNEGAQKYAPYNWEKGMPWSDIRDSLQRHVELWWDNENLDAETGLHHLAHVAANAMIGLEYYSLAPEFDDRPYTRQRELRIGLDIDEVLADWVGHWVARFGYADRPQHWNFDRKISEKFEQVKDDKEFWLSIPVLEEAKTLPFVPTCYVTARSIPNEWTEEWLDKNGFPASPCYTVAHSTDKRALLEELNIDWFIDDNDIVYKSLQNSRVTCWLMDAPHNQMIKTGRRIHNFNELPL